MQESILQSWRINLIWFVSMLLHRWLWIWMVFWSCPFLRCILDTFRFIFLKCLLIFYYIPLWSIEFGSWPGNTRCRMSIAGPEGVPELAMKISLILAVRRLGDGCRLGVASPSPYQAPQALENFEVWSKTIPSESATTNPATATVLICNCSDVMGKTSEANRKRPHMCSSIAHIWDVGTFFQWCVSNI